MDLQPFKAAKASCKTAATAPFFPGPFRALATLPEDLDIATQRNLSWSVEQMVKYRKDWCKQWLVRAKELEAAEKEDRSRRPVHVQQNTQNKRLLLTREILESIQYPDVEALEILRNGATLAGDIRHAPVFEEQFKPCLITRSQLENGASKRNQAILAMTTSSGDDAVDELLLEETRQEVSKYWVRGPYRLEDLPEGWCRDVFHWFRQTRHG